MRHERFLLPAFTARSADSGQAGERLLSAKVGEVIAARVLSDPASFRTCRRVQVASLLRSLHHRAASSQRGSVMLGVVGFVVAQQGLQADGLAFGETSLAALGAA